MATITDVAKLAGVSPSTVSHVVNGTRTVREPRRRRVLEAIAATGYATDGVARALRRSRTDSIGLVVADTGQPVFADMVHGIEREARAAGFTLLLANSADDPVRELESVRALRERRVDGLLLAGVGHSDPSLPGLLRTGSTAVVLVDRLYGSEFDQVGVENAPAMRAVVGHLLEQGHRRIAIAAGDLEVPTLGERLQGYLDAHADAGVDPDPRLVLTGTGQGVKADLADDMGRLLRAKRDRPSAVVTSSTVLTVGALRAAKRLGLRPPDDFAFVTFDQLAYAGLLSPSLTSVAQPAVRIGQQAMRLMLRRLQTPDAPIRIVRLRPTILHGESCGCGEPQRPLPI